MQSDPEDPTASAVAADMRQRDEFVREFAWLMQLRAKTAIRRARLAMAAARYWRVSCKARAAKPPLGT